MENKTENTQENNNIIDLLGATIEDFIDQYNIQDMTKESQNVWCACLMYCNKVLYADKNILKYKVNYDIKADNLTSNNNIYNYDLLNNIIETLSFYSLIYDKELSIYSFSLLTGIDNNIIYNWCNFNKRVQGLTYTGAMIWQKLVQINENTLSNIIVSGKRSPIGAIAKLNSKHQWNSNGYSRQETAQALGVDELPQLRQIAQTKQDQQ